MSQKQSQLRARPHKNSSDYIPKCKTKLNILNGAKTKEADYIEVGSLNTKSFCSGAGLQRILFSTAAHCITGDNLSIEQTAKERPPLFSKKASYVQG